MKTILFALLLLPAFLKAQYVPDHNYLWFTDTECNFSGIPIPEDPPCDIIRFFGRDTLWGDIRTNGCLSIQAIGDWSFYGGSIVMGCDSAEWRGPFPIPEGVVFNAPIIPFPDELTYLREAAFAQGLFLHEPGHEWYCSMNGTNATFYHYLEGTALDTLTAEMLNIDLTPRAIIFVDGKLDLRGVIARLNCEVLLAASGDIRLLDNVMLEGTNMVNGSIPANATSRIAIASEQGIYIANTWENGRENKTGPPPNNRDIVVTAYLSAIGTFFQLEQMNDLNDPYVSPSYPDERGNIVLTGGITQRIRGYVHRSNRGGTGYNKVYHYDHRLRNWHIGVFEPLDPFDEDPILSPVDNPLFPAQFTLSVAPNPFNASTTIRFTLPHLQSVRARVYDVQGREVMKLADRQYPAGSHVLQFNGESLASGVYFLTFQTADNVSTHKLMLLK